MILCHMFRLYSVDDGGYDWLASKIVGGSYIYFIGETKEDFESLQSEFPVFLVDIRTGDVRNKRQVY
jgi:hypothetical protein